MPPSIRGKLLAALAAVLTVLLVCAGCQGGGSGTAAPSDAPSAADCKTAAGEPVDKKATTIALVADNTASSATAGAPPAAASALADAQKQHDVLLLIPVDGPGKPVSIARRIPLDPYPGVDSAKADNGRRIVLGCVASWLGGPDMAPTAPGSDILAAVNFAARQQPSRLVVISDGVNSGGEFDLNQSAFDIDPDQLAASLAAGHALAGELAQRPVLWTGMAATSPPLPDPVHAELNQIWTSILTAASAVPTIDPRAGDRRAAPTGAPADKVEVPASTITHVNCATRISIPGALLFAGYSARLQPGVDGALAEVVADLRRNPGWVGDIHGNTADNRDVGQLDDVLSLQRARAVAGALTALGIDGSRLRPVGDGAGNPVADEFPNGQHDDVAAAKNRRVDVVLRPEGCRA
ncbi:OmpA family protein [Kutzneria sp. NPDC051319]|uniref:OmpA family protein n=1 Tax=Kutzneria sp. NPDC051319 TaxID=3155047 RepID=UPI0034328167